MQWSDTTNKTGIVEDIDFLCGTDSTSYPLVDKARNGNRWLYQIAVWILDSSYGWPFDDTDKTDLPIATFSLVNAQQDYELPVSTTGSLEGTTTAGAILKLLAVEIKDAGGSWRRLKEIKPFKPGQRITDLKTSDGLPTSYYLLGNSLFLEPAPATADVTLASGGKLFFARELDAIVSADTTKEPGFAEPFHRILSLGCSYDFMVSLGEKGRAEMLRVEMEAMKQGLYRFYGDRNQEVKVSIRPLLERYD